MKTNPQEEVKARLARKAEVLKRTFSTPNGLEALEILEEEFTRGKMFHPDPLSTAYLLGSREVVLYIQQLVKFGEMK